MVRTDERDMVAVRDFAAVLAGLDLGIVAKGRGGPDLEVRLPSGEQVLFEVKGLVNVGPADVHRLRQGTLPTVSRVLVADRIVPAAREMLNRAGWGWLDRRGHFRLKVPGRLLVDADIEPLAGDADATPARPTLDTPVGLDVAAALLSVPNESQSVRDLVRLTDRSLAAVHAAVSGLRDEGLIRADGRPLVPELFWETSARWRPQRVPVMLAPQPGDAQRTDQLHLGLEDIENTTGWAVCDTIAANAWGAFNVIRGDYPPDLYVPDDRNVRVARQLYGDALTSASRGATVGVPAVAWACRRRHDIAARGIDSPWAHFGFVHPVIAALDLSIDAARGREVLDEWTPPSPFARVW